MSQLAELRSDVAAVRAAAVGQLRFVQLKDPQVLAAALDLCADDTVVAEVAAADPFAAFFSGGAAQEARTVGDAAVDRLDRAGLPREAWDDLAGALARHPDHPRLLAAAARWAAETRWTDPLAALRALVPPLQAADQPLLGLVARADDAGRAYLIDRALAPWNARTLQELLNHPDAQPAVIAAIEERLLAGSVAPDAQQALLLLGLLAGWESPAAARVARSLEAAHPWAVAYRALTEPEALPALRTWLRGGEAAPSDLGWRWLEVARQRPRVDGWPMTDWVRRFGLGAESFDVWGCDDGAIEWLIERVRAGFAAGGDRLEAWNAVVVLVAEGAHAAVDDLIAAAAVDDLPWDADVLSRLAAARPPVTGWVDAFNAAARRSGDPNPGLRAAEELTDEALQAVLPALLDVAAALPTVDKPAGPGWVRRLREGLDDTQLRRLADRVGDPDLVARATALEPSLRAKE